PGGARSRGRPPRGRACPRDRGGEGVRGRRARRPGPRRRRRDRSLSRAVPPPVRRPGHDGATSSPRKGLGMTTWRAFGLGRGGGATGEFQMGVLPVLARAIPAFDFFAGVGVGSLHATVLAQQPDSFPAGVDALIDLWKTIVGQRDILEMPFEGANLSTLAALT